MVSTVVIVALSHTWFVINCIYVFVRVFKRAARINERTLILVGSTEWQKGMVSVKILSTGEQSEVNVDELE